MDADAQNKLIENLQAENQTLREQLRQALQRIEELERAAHRQAAPFRRDPRKIIPPEQRKRPGRKEGHEGCFRTEPPVIDELIDVPLERCPRCGGALQSVSVLEQVIEEIEPVRPKVIKLRTRVGLCTCCGQNVRSTHPLQSSLAGGCARVQLGPRALGLAALLNKVCGLTMRKTTLVMQKLCGLKLSAGGLSQAMCRVARRVAGHYEKLIEEIRASPAVNADETSWYVGRAGFWLWCFVTPCGTVYRVDDSRGSDVVRAVLGENFAGVLVSDCLRSYDPVNCRKHKCFAHHLRAIAQAGGENPGEYLRQWRVLLKTANMLYQERRSIEARRFEQMRLNLEALKDRLLDQPLSDEADKKIRARLIKHRPHLLRCLQEPAAEPTNNRAERALRPAVIARKLSCGNRSENGKRAWEVLASLGATCQQRGQDLVTFLAAAVPLAGG
jgi:hypothetical protein